jgi:hypothetical protein
MEPDLGCADLRPIPSRDQRFAGGGAGEIGETGEGDPPGRTSASFLPASDPSCPDVPRACIRPVDLRPDGDG